MAATYRPGYVTHRGGVPPTARGATTARGVSLTARAQAPETPRDPSIKLPEWTVLSPQGPALSHHVGAVIRNKFYVHGGIDKKGSCKPIGKLFCMDFSTGMWCEIRAARCPALSHHASVVVEDRYLVIVGGWNGHRRCTDVFVYDAQEETWSTLNTEGFPVGGGLSSHTLEQLDGGDLLVVGREGSARTQKRMSHTYALRGSLLRGRFVYEEQPVNPASRSGHTMHFTSGNLLFIYGGRADEPIEGHRGFVPGGNRQTPPAMAKLREFCQSKLKPIAGRLPGGRKFHVSLAGAGAIFIHGGETFDGKNREPVGEMYLIVTKSDLAWYRLGSSEGRAGHVIVYHNDNVYIHGGEGAKGIVYGATYKFSIP